MSRRFKAIRPPVSEDIQDVSARATVTRSRHYGGRVDRVLRRLVLAFGLCGGVHAQWVWVDPSFPEGNGPNDRVRAIAVQADGMLLVGGFFTNLNDKPRSSVDGVPRAVVARLDENGSLDVSFDPGLGAKHTEPNPFPEMELPPYERTPFLRVVLPLADGCVMVGGAFKHFNEIPRRLLVRLHPDSRVDDTFASPFIGVSTFRVIASISSAVRAIVTQPDGKLIVAGHFWTSGNLRPPAKTAVVGATGWPHPLLCRDPESIVPNGGLRGRLTWK